MTSNLDEVVFYSIHNIKNGLYIDNVKKNLMCYQTIESLHDAILAYNCMLFIENGIRGTNWTSEEYETIKENADRIKGQIGGFIKKHSTIILEEFNELSQPYKKSVLQMSERYGCYKDWKDVQVSMVLDNTTITLFLYCKKITNYFKNVLVTFFDNNPLIAARLILEENNRIGESNDYCLPFGEKEKAKYLTAYIYSEKAVAGGLLNILQMPSSIKKYITPKDLAFAKGKYEESLEKLSVNNLDFRYCVNIRIEFRKMKDLKSQEYDDKTKTFTQSFSLDELCENLDYRGIFRSLYYIFDFIGNRTGVIPLARKTKEKEITDFLFSNRCTNGYNLDFNQDIEKTITYLTLLEYYDFLIHQGVSIEEALGKGFSEIVTGFGIKGFHLDIPTQSVGDYRTKCEVLAPRITELYKQMYICLRKEDINDYYINAIQDIHWGELKSLFPTKYLYVSDKPDIKQKVNRLSRLMFSYQSSFVIERYAEENINSNFDLFLHYEIGRKDINEVYNNEVDYLLDQRCLIEKDGVLKPTRFSQVLLELWENECISLLHTDIFKDGLAYFVQEGWLIKSNTLLTKSEQELLAYLYGNKFSDSLGIRNIVEHVSNHGFSEEEHKQNYLWMIYMVIVLELKFLEELEYQVICERTNHNDNNQQYEKIR